MILRRAVATPSEGYTPGLASLQNYRTIREADPDLEESVGRRKSSKDASTSSQDVTPRGAAAATQQRFFTQECFVEGTEPGKLRELLIDATYSAFAAMLGNDLMRSKPQRQLPKNMVDDLRVVRQFLDGLRINNFEAYKMIDQRLQRHFQRQDMYWSG
ncbi:unnamed protein product, partial [Amoebophrya sp. A25]|eukprot:GSA25T00001303001.1